MQGLESQDLNLTPESLSFGGNLDELCGFQQPSIPGSVYRTGTTTVISSLQGCVASDPPPGNVVTVLTESRKKA